MIKDNLPVLIVAAMPLISSGIYISFNLIGSSLLSCSPNCHHAPW